jgi:heme-degrading monooxygenase HmoA
MIKVIIGYKVKSGSDIESTMFKLRQHAMTFPGYVSSENLLSQSDRSIFAMVQTWETLDDWKAWEPSAIRRQIHEEAKALLQEEPRVTVYRVISTRGFGNPTRSS